MATLAARISDLAGAVRDKINLMMPRLLPAGGTTGQVLQKTSNLAYAVGWTTPAAGGGGADVWTRTKLAADTVTTATAFAEFLSISVPDGKTVIVEADLLLATAATTNMPRVQVSCTNISGGGNIEYPTSATARAFAQGWYAGGSTFVFSIPAGTAPIAGGTLPYETRLKVHGTCLTGLTGTVSLQFAAELTTSACYLKAGSEIRYRII